MSYLLGSRLEIYEFIRMPALQVHQWTFKNNGNIFDEKDWKRVKSIADGNPLEHTVGAFGVGK